jgi:deoxyribodipyrimidine photo-lyase
MMNNKKNILDKKYELSLFVFRRDLRIEDNTGLILALENSKQVIPCFILDERQIDEKNEYRSDNAIFFMRNCLLDLDLELKKRGSKLYLFEGVAEDVILDLIKNLKIDAVFLNRDYTPFSKRRDDKIKDVCSSYKVDFNSCSDLLLNEPEDVLKDDGEIYKVFSAYFRKASLFPIKPVFENKFLNYYKNNNEFDKDKINNDKIRGFVSIDLILKDREDWNNKDIFLKGGRDEGLKLLDDVCELKDYKRTRDIPSIVGTSRLSAHIKFGTVSIREVYFKVANCLSLNSDLIKQLYWRDFFVCVAYYYPHVFSGPFKKNYNKIKWENDEHKFKAWCLGETGYPMVDAGMRELNTTGWMHGRARMVCASFLVKNLNVDWRLGEKYFAKKLIDYDPCVNNGSWQWVAGCGCDSVPYFRIFNPDRQQKKFDEYDNYVKKWVVEYRTNDYVKPIVDYKISSKNTKELYKMFLYEM